MNDDRELNVIWQMDNTDCLVPDGYVDYDDDYDGVKPTIQRNKDHIGIADAYRLFETGFGLVQLQGLFHGEWQHAWHTGSLINHLVNQIKDYENRLGIRCSDCGGDQSTCLALMGAAPCQMDTNQNRGDDHE